jgi:ferrochelatase
MKKTAVFLLNLGGPDSIEAVQPFLFNLFYDPAIISLPNPFRYILAKLISGKRHKEAKEIYSLIGGKSPILENTMDQVRALQGCFNKDYVRVFSVMRYWHPRAEDVVEEALSWGADEILCVPLYPQYSTTTTESSYLEVSDILKKRSFSGDFKLACCYASHPLWIEAVSDMLRDTLQKVSSEYKGASYTILFSAHGLPEKVINAGDPYQFQVEESVGAIKNNLCLSDDKTIICYQSRVGPLKWIGPATDDMIVKLSREGKGIIVVPVAFVSEHSETLVELDIEYKELAMTSGAAFYERVPTVGSSEKFIQSLKAIVAYLMACEEKILCPKNKCSGFKKCGGRFA